MAGSRSVLDGWPPLVEVTRCIADGSTGTGCTLASDSGAGIPVGDVARRASAPSGLEWSPPPPPSSSFLRPRLLRALRLTAADSAVGDTSPPFSGASGKTVAAVDNSDISFAGDDACDGGRGVSPPLTCVAVKVALPS